MRRQRLIYRAAPSTSEKHRQVRERKLESAWAEISSLHICSAKTHLDEPGFSRGTGPRGLRAWLVDRNWLLQLRRQSPKTRRRQAVDPGEPMIRSSPSLGAVTGVVQKEKKISVRVC